MSHKLSALVAFALLHAQEAMITLCRLSDLDFLRIKMELSQTPFRLRSTGAMQVNFDVEVEGHPDLVAKATVYVEDDGHQFKRDGVILTLPDTSWVFSYYPDRVTDSRVDNADYVERLRKAVQT